MASERPSTRLRAGVGAPAEEREAWIVLAGVDGVGPVTFGRLLAAFGSARAVLDAALGGRLVRRLLERERGRPAGIDAAPLPPRSVVEGIAMAARQRDESIEGLRRLGITALTWLDAAYPLRLHGLEAEPPILYLRGDASALARPRAVAVVGTRRPTPAGRLLAASIGGAVARAGASVVSGLAFGCDAAAHSAAVEAGGVTVAVVGGGLAEITPRAHTGLAGRIEAAGGAVVSELAPRARPTHGTYPRRNRLIAALADQVVVVEAPRRSGALNTAHWAAEQGRDLYVAPGRPGDRATAGCLYLLHDLPDCRPVVGVQTLLEDLGLAGAAEGPVVAGAGAGPLVLIGALPATEGAVAAGLRDGPTTPDRLARATGLPIEQVVAALGLLELRGYARAAAGLYLPAGDLVTGA